MHLYWMMALHIESVSSADVPTLSGGSQRRRRRRGRQRSRTPSHAVNNNNSDEGNMEIVKFDLILTLLITL